MIRLALAALILIAGLVSPAAAQQRVRVGLMRVTENGGVFLAASQGYFKAEGLEVELRAYPSPTAVAEALAGGAVDFAIAAFTPLSFSLAGRGTIKIIAAQARERRGYEGNAVLASNAAYAKGLRGYADLANKVVAISAFGSAFHYQLGEIAHREGFPLGGVTLKPLQSLDVMARALQQGNVDAAILPARYARDLMMASQAKFIGWCSEVDEPQLGALFTRAGTIAEQRTTVERFVRAYRRGVANYAGTLLRHSLFGKRVIDAKADAAAALIAAYVYPDGSNSAAAVEASAYFIDPRARIDINDIARQIAWHKAQKLVVDADGAAAVDLSFTAGP